MKSEPHAHGVEPHQFWRLRQCRQLERRRLSGALVHVLHVMHCNDPKYCYCVVDVVTPPPARYAVSVRIAHFDRREKL